MSDLIYDITQLNDATDNYRKQGQNLAKSFNDTITQVVSEFIKSQDRVKCIAWIQYQPGFNDGDATHWRLRNIYVSSEDAWSFDEDYHNGDNFSYSDDYVNEAKLTKLLNAEDAKKIMAIFKTINNHDIFLEKLYDGNAIVKITANGLESDYYDPGY